ncbi:MAG TPA: hypothetical protein VMF04_00500 [Thermoplasmata archaeon]|nr:hypothetical protein [Thermoplasmata archaeon]
MALARELSERLPELPRSVTEGGPRIRLITGPTAIYPSLREML